MDLQSLILSVKTVDNFKDFKVLIERIFTVITDSSDDQLSNDYSKLICQFLDIIYEQISPKCHRDHIPKQQLQEIIELSQLIIKFLTSSLSNLVKIDEFKALMIILVIQSDQIVINNKQAIFDSFLNINQQSFDVYLNKKLLKNVISFIKHRTVDCEEWPITFANSDIIYFIIHNLSNEKLTEYIYDLFPLAMQILSSPLVSNQSIGLKCIFILLNDNRCCDILQQNGYLDLLFTKMKLLLHNTDLKPFYYVMLINNLHSLITYQNHHSTNQNDYSQLTDFGKQTKSDEIYTILIENINFKDDSELVEMYISSLIDHVMPIMHCNLMKHGNITIKCIDHLLDRCLLYASDRLMAFIMHFIDEYLNYINFYLKYDHTKSILVKLAKIYRKSNLSEETIEFREKIVKIYDSFENSNLENNVLFTKKFRSKLKI